MGDINPGKFELAKKLGCTKCLNPKDFDKPMQQVLVGESPTGFGYDYTFDCTGNVSVMRSALEAAHRGWGLCVLIGVAPAGAEIQPVHSSSSQGENAQEQHLVVGRPVTQFPCWSTKP